MLESNTFRIMMTVGSLIVTGIVILGFFVYPIIKFDDSNPNASEQQLLYNRVMLEEGKEYLTAFDVTKFYIKAKPRADVRHY